MADEVGRYTLEIREQGEQLSRERLGDPFIHTTIHVQGWRSALAVLRRRYTVEVHVMAERDVVDQVMALNLEHADA